jgi:hypothetical protein
MITLPDSTSTANTLPILFTDQLASTNSRTIPFLHLHQFSPFQLLLNPFQIQTLHL